MKILNAMLKLLVFFPLLTVSLLWAPPAPPSNSPDISIDPTDQNITLGTVSVTLNINLSEAGNKNSIDIDYSTSNCDGSSGTVTIEEGDTQGSIPINTSALSINDICTVTLDSASGNGSGTNAQSVGSISPNTSTITVTSNSPDISIDPIAKSIKFGTNSAELNVILSEAGNADDISVTYEHNCTTTNNTGTVSIAEGNTTQSFDINTTGLSTGTSCLVTLKNPIGDGDQNVGTISPDTSTITVIATSADLNITKTASNTSVFINTSFVYTIKVRNNGEDNATNVIVTDTLPSGLSIDIDATNSNSSGWNCTENNSIVSCELSGDLESESTIEMHVTAPSTEGTITNEVNVTSDNEIDFSDNFDKEETSIVDTNKASDLCYTNSTYTETQNNSCISAGVSYYKDTSKSDCTAIMTIKALADLTDINITKLYSPGNISGTCDDTSDYTCSTNDSSYTYELSELSNDTNITIRDTNTYSNVGEITDINLSATYVKDSLTYSGEIFECPLFDVTEFTAQVDVVDEIISKTSPYIGIITTKVSNKDNYTLTATYLGGYNENPHSDNTVPQVGVGGQALTIPMAITYFLTDETCSEDVEIPLYLDYTAGPDSERVVSIIETSNSSDETDPFIMSYNEDNSNTLVENLLVKEIVRIKYKAVNLNILFAYADETCVGSSSIDGGIKGIPQCITSESGNSTPAELYRNVFGNTAFERCWEGTDSDGDPTGSPCLSSNGGWGLPPYDNEYGCLECSLGEFPWVCSQDAFAIRPDNFDINNTSDEDFPNLLRAGEDYNMSINAYHYDAPDSTTIDYNQTKTNMDLNQTRYLANGDDDDGTLNGDLVWSAWDFHISNGTSHRIGEYPITLPIENEAAGIQYDDVGKINISIEDRKWAAIDIDNEYDTTPHDCSPDGAYICGDKNVTYIPHHFRFETLNITSNSGAVNDFTYIADNRGKPLTFIPPLPERSPMAARIQTQIRALTKNGDITQNFRTEATSTPYNPTLYYENDVNITMEIIVPTSGTNKYIYPNADESNVTDSYIGFGRGGIDQNGTRNVLWDEDNFPLEFNFDRYINEPADPFDVNGSYIKSIKIISHYLDPDDLDTADINGSRLGDWNNTVAIAACATDDGCDETAGNADGNTIFYYARSKASQFFYDDVTESNKDTPIIINIYCNPAYTTCTDWDINTTLAQTNEFGWWLSRGHIENNTRNDGNVTLKVGTTDPTGEAATVNGTSTTNVRITSGGIEPNVNVATTSSVRPLTVPIELVNRLDPTSPAYGATASPYTNEWLIYNPDSATLVPSPFYKVRFIGVSDWAGHGDTGHVVDSNTSTKKNRRLGW